MGGDRRRVKPQRLCARAHRRRRRPGGGEGEDCRVFRQVCELDCGDNGGFDADGKTRLAPLFLHSVDNAGEAEFREYLIELK